MSLFSRASKRVQLFLILLFCSLFALPIVTSSAPNAALNMLRDNAHWVQQARDNRSAPPVIQHFDARLVTPNIELSWVAFSEHDVDGFRIYRMRHDQSFVAIVNNDGLIPPWHQAYTDTDLTPSATYRYVLAVVLRNGSEVLSNPVDVSTSSGSAPARGIQQSGF